jgi:hypothetical protein
MDVLKMVWYRMVRSIRGVNFCIFSSFWITL